MLNVYEYNFPSTVNQLISTSNKLIKIQSINLLRVRVDGIAENKKTQNTLFVDIIYYIIILFKFRVSFLVL
jgi:hypothetical protein